MGKLWVFAVMILLIFSCKRNLNPELQTGDADMEINAEDLPKRVAVNTKSNDILQEWPEYVAFDNRFTAIYNVSNNEDLILLVVDLIEKQKQWEESTYPEVFDVAQIRSRQQVVKTYLLKIKSALDYRDDFETPTREMIDAYNGLRGQFDVIMNRTLDPKLLLDED